MKTTGFEEHDHQVCASRALLTAERHCRAHGLRFTPVRRQVLEILLEGHRALGAYEVLEHMNTTGRGAKPPAAYRALDFLVSNGFAHRIEKLNAFVACAHPGKTHTPVFMICRRCDLVEEANFDPDASLLGNAARKAGFLIENTVEEAEGICPLCRKPGET